MRKICSLFAVTTLALCSALASANDTGSAASSTSEIYRYHGLKAAVGAAARDGIYQDFSHDGDNLGKIWGDPDAPLHGSSQTGWLRAEVLRNEDQPFLRLEFAREGYGVNAGIGTKKRIPEIIPPGGVLIFEARSSNGACAGLRFMERDGEVWGYGKPGLKYDRICLKPGTRWQQFSIPLTERSRWFKFIYDGNTELGNNTMEADLLASLTLELGTYQPYHLGRGAATFDIRNIRVSPESQSVSALD